MEHMEHTERKPTNVEEVERAIVEDDWDGEGSPGTPSVVEVNAKAFAGHLDVAGVPPHIAHR